MSDDSKKSGSHNFIDKFAGDSYIGALGHPPE